MSLLSYKDLCKLVAAQVITDVELDQINSTSIDITLGNTLLIEDVDPEKDTKVVALRARNPLTCKRITMKQSGGYYLKPGEFILAQSVQSFNLPFNMSAEYKLKSSMARIGLEHMNAGWCDAGWHGSVLTLELKNMTRDHIIYIQPGDRIGQMVFFEHEFVPEDKSYAARGRYNNDKSVKGVKP
jgi:dCTP deaminase